MSRSACPGWASNAGDDRPPRTGAESRRPARGEVSAYALNTLRTGRKNLSAVRKPWPRTEAVSGSHVVLAPPYAARHVPANPRSCSGVRRKSCRCGAGRRGCRAGAARRGADVVRLRGQVMMPPRFADTGTGLLDDDRHGRPAMPRRADWHAPGGNGRSTLPPSAPDRLAPTSRPGGTPQSRRLSECASSARWFSLAIHRRVPRWSTRGSLTSQRLAGMVAFRRVSHQTFLDRPTNMLLIAGQALAVRGRRRRSLHQSVRESQPCCSP